ncbi:MAG: peptidoglycan bridge formation glycyltransferase FemA/FemB family protein, partial [Clostridia bacterium]
MELYTEKSAVEFKEFIRNHPKGHYLQIAEWGKVKKDWKWEGIIVRNDEGKIVGTLSVLIRKVPMLPYSLMYAPRGPVCDVHDADTFKKLANGAKELAKQYNCYMIKMDPDILASDEEFIKIAKDNGFVIKSDSKDFDGIQPKYVFRLDVEGKTEEEMMASFHSKTRYNIRVAIKNKVEVKVCTKEALKEFVPIMEVTGGRDSFITRPIEYFENMSDKLGENMRIYMAYFEGMPIAGAIATAFGDKVWYMYGASANVHRNKMPNYLVQFEMIKWALELG